MWATRRFQAPGAASPAALTTPALPILIGRSAAVRIGSAGPSDGVWLRRCVEERPHRYACLRVASPRLAE
ncbi:hypothetical protein [Streptomyces sp. NPDC102283]|uniref:hypothetical protein n=1 Tax=Streptomyces sp. NPDC102283 TaxID=3366155 RepID=UPI00305CFD0F